MNQLFLLRFGLLLATGALTEPKLSFVFEEPLEGLGERPDVGVADPESAGFSSTEVEESLRAEVLARALMASALEFGAVGHFLRSVESIAEVEVAGEGVCDGVQGEGGPIGKP